MLGGFHRTAVTWSINPAAGAISATGVYTAPPSIPNVQSVIVTATNIQYGYQASATITLSPVTVSVSPATVTLVAPQTQFFNATIGGTANTAVTWSLNPSIGTLSAGAAGAVYAPPASIAGSQTVNVVATSVADPTRTAKATITLNSSPVTVQISPANATLTNGQGLQFTASAMGAANTAVTWSISAALGVVSAAGLYTAPAVIANAQTVRVIATSAADPTKSASANISLIPDTTSPAISLTSPANGATITGIINIAATATDNAGVASVQFQVDGSAAGAGVTAPPYSMAWNSGAVANGAHVITAIARDAAGNQASQSATVTVNNQSATVKLPIEVVGPDGTTQSAIFNLPSPVSKTRLWMQIHNLKYETEASVQFNGGSWIPINTSTVTLQGLAANYGGIGGGFHTLKLTVPIPDGLLVAGANTVTFRFNGTDGISSGFRVIKINFLKPDGTQILPDSTFVQDDPNTWQPPSRLASDIAAGKTLWQTASLTTPVPGGAPMSIQARCGMCHTQDGRDLKYFNYSNQSITARALFHGLSAQQAAQIASYIRSLNIPNPGRPWNPPYQPGPGLDSLPVSQWAAGAGIDAVLDSDGAMQPSLTPGGSTAGWAAAKYVNTREMPIVLQLPDWNGWLPAVHPVDIAGAGFTSSSLNLLYSQLRGMLSPGDPVSYGSSILTLDTWTAAGDQIFFPPFETVSNWTSSNRQNLYSAALWLMVKEWELNQEFGLEAMPQVPYGAKADVRGWFGGQAFQTSPFMLHIPFGPGLGNGTQVSYEYLAYIWYHLQSLLNDGQGGQSDHTPIDYGYVEGVVKDLSISSGNTPAAMLELMWLVKALQEETLIGLGPQNGTLGFQPTTVSPVVLVNTGWESDWSATPAATRTSLTQSYVQNWFSQISGYTAAQYYLGKDGNGRPWASLTENPRNSDYLQTFGGQVWFMLPRLRYVGVDSNLVSQISNWAATVWPAGNWALNNAATCTNLGTCTSDR